MSSPDKAATNTGKEDVEIKQEDVLVENKVEGEGDKDTNNLENDSKKSSVSERHQRETKDNSNGVKRPDSPITPKEMDVLCGRGGLSNHHPGNEWYRRLIRTNRHLYRACPKHTKLLVARAIVEAVEKQGGRFLDKHSPKNKHKKEAEAEAFWYVVSHKRAVDKTSQGLRERETVDEDEPPPPVRLNTMVQQNIIQQPPQPPSQLGGFRPMLSQSIPPDQQDLQLQAYRPILPKPTPSEQQDTPLQRQQQHILKSSLSQERANTANEAAANIASLMQPRPQSENSTIPAQVTNKPSAKPNMPNIMPPQMLGGNMPNSMGAFPVPHHRHFPGPSNPYMSDNMHQLMLPPNMRPSMPFNMGEMGSYTGTADDVAVDESAKRKAKREAKRKRRRKERKLRRKRRKLKRRKKEAKEKTKSGNKDASESDAPSLLNLADVAVAHAESSGEKKHSDRHKSDTSSDSSSSSSSSSSDSSSTSSSSSSDSSSLTGSEKEGKRKKSAGKRGQGNNWRKNNMMPQQIGGAGVDPLYQRQTRILPFGSGIPPAMTTMNHGMPSTYFPPPNFDSRQDSMFSFLNDAHLGPSMPWNGMNGQSLQGSTSLAYNNSLYYDNGVSTQNNKEPSDDDANANTGSKARKESNAGDGERRRAESEPSLNGNANISNSPKPPLNGLNQQQLQREMFLRSQLERTHMLMGTPQNQMAMSQLRQQQQMQGMAPYMANSVYPPGHNLGANFNPSAAQMPMEMNDSNIAAQNLAGMNAAQHAHMNAMNQQQRLMMARGMHGGFPVNQPRNMNDQGNAMPPALTRLESQVSEWLTSFHPPSKYSDGSMPPNTATSPVVSEKMGSDKDGNESSTASDNGSTPSATKDSIRNHKSNQRKRKHASNKSQVANDHATAEPADGGKRRKSKGTKATSDAIEAAVASNIIEQPKIQEIPVFQKEEVHINYIPRLAPDSVVKTKKMSLYDVECELPKIEIPPLHYDLERKMAQCPKSAKRTKSDAKSQSPNNSAAKSALSAKNNAESLKGNTTIVSGNEKNAATESHVQQQPTTANSGKSTAVTPAQYSGGIKKSQNDLLDDYEESPLEQHMRNV